MFLIKYLLVFITGCAFAFNNSNKDPRNRLENLSFVYLEPSSFYLVADGEDKVDFTLKDEKGKKIENFALFYSFNDSPYKQLSTSSLSSHEEGNLRVYAQTDEAKSIENIIHIRKNLKAHINISKFASIEDLYLEDRGQKLRLKGKTSFSNKNVKYVYNKEILENLLPFQNLESAAIEVYLNNSKLGDIYLKLYDIELEIDKSKLKVGNSLKDIIPRKIINGKEENTNIQELIVKNIDFSIRENVNKEKLEAGTYFVSIEAEINGEKIHINERQIEITYEHPFKSSQIIPLPSHLIKLKELNFKINNTPFLKKSENLYVSNSMLIYKDSSKIFAFIIGDLITSSSLDIFDNENIIDSLMIKGSTEMVKLSNIGDWPGLINLSNTCFFNSAIKALASTTILDSQLETNRDKNLEIRNLIRALVNAIRLGKESPFYLSDTQLNNAVQKELIKKILRAISNSSTYHERVDDGLQHDCSEVLSRILELVMIDENIGNVAINSLSIENNSNEDKYPEAKGIYDRNRAALKNIVMTQFFLKDSQINITEKFLFEPISYEFFKFFNLGKTLTVQELVDNNLDYDEIIEEFLINPVDILEKNIPKENYRIGENKNFFIHVTKVKKILEISNYFILNINRKLVDLQKPTIQLKDERKVLNIKEILNLPYFDYSSKTYGKIEFEPIACTVHLGSSNGGHYIAYVKEKESGKWYVNNDREVKEKELTNDVGTIYSILYEKK